MRLCLYTAILMIGANTPLGAQAVPSDSSRPPTLALRQPGLWEQAVRRATSDSTDSLSRDTPSVPDVLRRAGAGTAGAVVGAFVGGLAGYRLLPHSDCDCDDPGLREFIIGAAVGGVAGAALAAAFPKQRSRCSYGRRVAYGVVGAVAGGTLGLVAPSDQRVIFVPLGAGTGAGLASAFC